MTAEPIAHDAGGRPIFVGSVVRLTDDVAHLYDEGKSRSWTVERTLEPGESYKKPESLEPEAQLRWFNSPRTLVIRNPDGVSTFAPALWVTTAPPSVIAPSAAPSDLRELALVFFNNRNLGYASLIDALTRWGIDYVHRTNPPTSEPAPEPMFPSGSMQKVVAALVALGELKEAAAYSTVDIVDAIGRLSERNHKRIAELEQTLAEARKALGGVG